MSPSDSLPLLSFPDAAAFERWLAEHHASSPGIWLAIAKKGAVEPTVGYVEALDVALCYGWIDGQKGTLDAERWRQRFTPRKGRSKWSKINCGKVNDLVAQGRMRPAGLREVEAAKADGRWEAAYAGQRTAEMPEDFERVLAADPAAREFFAALDRANRYAILYRIHEAKKPETRARRIEKFVAMLRAGEKIHP